MHRENCVCAIIGKETQTEGITLNFEEKIVSAALAVGNSHAKALASYLFREIIEEAHVKYNISQDDVKAMCKDAVNRAALFLEIKDDPKLYRAFAVHALEGSEWDEPEETEDVKKERETLQSLI